MRHIPEAEGYGPAFLDRFLRMARTEGLGALSVRWMQPIQQHGRRFPSSSWTIIRSTCSCLVSRFLTKVTQQIHSLRASGVMLSHAARAFRREARALRISAGIP
jgi:hypothetical protein